MSHRLPTGLVLGLTLAGLATGGALALAGRGDAADASWAATAAIALVPLTWSVGRSLARRDVGVDLIALLAIAAALALGEYLAAAVVALMMSGGTTLERLAARRSQRELTALLSRAPHTTRLRRGGALVEVPVEAVVVGDVVLVRPGEVVPVDGVVERAVAVVDEAALTGESLPVTLAPGAPIRSGGTNAGGTFDVRATRPAAESSYAAIVRLVRDAASQRAPFVRLADRYAAIFLPATLLIAGAAWAASGDPVRALAVLVVATPCPLILAAPIALVCGVSRAARRGVIVKGAGVIEGLGRARGILLDKTGTLTVGAPAVDRIVALNGRPAAEVLRLAASLEQVSAHVLAQALVREARREALDLALPDDVVERPGEGVMGRVEGRRVVAGTAAWLRKQGCEPPDDQQARLAAADGRAAILVGIDGEAAAVFVMADHVRADASGLVARLRRAGVTEVALATGDDEAVAAEVARRVGVEEVHWGLTPEDKLALVSAMRERSGGGVVMVGDGVNDAPALAMADVGIAMGSTAATASSEAADAVIAVDRVDRVAEAIEIGRRSVHIAVQSVLVGMALSGVAMILAAIGLIPPLGGALLQEGIDVAVIANALRALHDGR
jgi:heavy metal translocating P-type ATPase